MSSQLVRPVRSSWLQCVRQKSAACFSTSARRTADEPPNPATSLLDAINPAKTSRPSPASTIPSRDPATLSSTTTSANPSLFPFPSGMGSRPDVRRQTPRTQPASPSNNGRTPGNATDRLMNALRPQAMRAGASSNPFAARQANTALTQRTRQLEAQHTRTWRDGDIYAPHDLSSAEQLKARFARYGPRFSNLPPANTRKRGSKDVLDDLGLDATKEYKNFALLSEFVTEMGRIRHGRETGLRGVNQRRVARAVRRAVGMGIMPSVHRHPELHEERVKARGTGIGRFGGL